MKKIFFILSFVFVSSARLFAQDDDDAGNESNSDKMRDKMKEFIQKRLDLTKEESEKFTPVFIKYFTEWRQTLREVKGLPKLDRQQKLLDLQLRYRTQFREIMGSTKGDQVFEHQRRFIQEVIRINNERAGNVPARPLRRRGG
jgi:hypothetical protein